MTGHPNHNFDAFEAAAVSLRQRGMTVEAPHDINKHLTPDERDKMSREHWVRLDLRQLLRCDEIILLPGWEAATGARRELDIALDLRMPVWILNFDGSLTCITGRGDRERAQVGAATVG
jgi:hypothetical protein